MLKFLWGGSQEEQPREIPAQSSWYPSSSGLSTSGSSSFNHPNVEIPSDSPELLSDSQFSSTEAATIFGLLKNKSLDELGKLLSDKDAYDQFLLSLEVVRIQNNVLDELRKETLQIARDNLEKEPRFLELKDQCRMIRTTDLTSAQEQLNTLKRQNEESFSSMLLQKLQETMDKVEEESENLQRQIIEKEIKLAVFVQKCKKLRTTYQRVALIQLAAKSSFSR